MPKIIKIRCNGSEKHVNEVNLEKYSKPTIVVRGGTKSNSPERLVIPCQHCSEGKVIITREMMEKSEK
jgi:hypothetical protein